MPTYEYVCVECGENIEVKASVSEKEKGLKVSCPKCGSSKTARIFGNFTVMSGVKGGSPSGGFPSCGPNAGPGCCG